MPTHSDPDELALLALGERTARSDPHLATCAQCQSELDQLRAVVATARRIEPEDQPVTPPPHVWDAVVAELGLGRVVEMDELAARRDRASGRRATLLAVAAAVVVGLVAGVLGTLVATRSDDPTIVASTDLFRLSDQLPTGDAEILRTSTGRELELDVFGLPEVDGVYEVWLLDSSGDRLVSLGLLDDTRERLPLPAGIDVSEYAVVDVSVEPTDGDPTHSGNSVVRGTLAS